LPRADDYRKRGNTMSAFKMVVTDYIEPDLQWEEEQAKNLDIDFHAYQLKTAEPAELINACQDAEVVVVNMARFTDEVISELPNTKLILRHGIGYDNVDIHAANQQNIMVGYYPDYCVNEVAEQALMLMFACQRKIQHQFKILKQSSELGQWQFHEIMPVYSLHGKTIGIVGAGRIGSTLIKLLKGFEVNILVTDPYLSPNRKADLKIQTIPLEALIKNSDIISIHCPLKWEETYHMFDEPQFKLMKSNAVLINTARGGIVNLSALDKALRIGQLAMAGIDVYEQEPPPPEHPILNNERVLCTPHLSWLSEEAGWNIRKKIMEDVERYTLGLPPVHQINKDVPSFIDRMVN
jgi:D-3-phosphoglycerate dehydrogenase / 2-oxoglutarate reductase